ncbi:MAG: helix-turn-helix transcriptional regulator, partial [Polyangiaceae bacterium]
SRLLLAHAERVERARDRRGTDPNAVVDLWPALVAGHLSLVERGTGRSRRYLVVENGTGAQATRALTSAEIDVLAHASRGLSSKLISYALGISSSAVSMRLASAASKIGASSRLELVRLAAMVTRDPRAGVMGATTLTAAERDVLELLQHGLSNAQIAKIRSRSVRTIANQVASLLKKTNSHTRRAMLACADDAGAPQR